MSDGGTATTANGGIIINDLGIATVLVYFGVMVLQFIGCFVFQVYRRRVQAGIMQSAEKKLKFESPDDTPRIFRQYGLKFSIVGYCLLKSWTVFCILAYLYMIVFFVISQQEKAYKAMFGKFEALRTPWFMVFTATHLIMGVLVYLNGALNSLFMLPTNRLSDATHIAVYEVTNAVSIDVNAESANEEESSLCTNCQKYLASASSTMILPVEEDGQGSKHIMFTCVRYFFDYDSDSYCPTGTTTFTPQAAHAQVKVGGLTQCEANDYVAGCGENTINVRVDGIFESLTNEFCQITYVISSIAVLGYFIDNCWNIGGVWAMMAVFSGTYKALGVIRPNQIKIRDLARMSREVVVLREGEWVTLNSKDIALGDVIRLEEGEIPVDGLVVQGSVVVNECMLTGEPMPIQKVALEPGEHATVSKKNQVYGGTINMQMSTEGALMIATGIGASTMRGQLVRMVLFPSHVKFKTDDQMSRIRLILFAIAFCINIPLLTPLINLDTLNATYAQFICTIAIAFNPMLGTSMLLGQLSSCRRLEGDLKITCMQPNRIPIAGKISVMVFDKTGTITKDSMEFESVKVVEGGKFGDRHVFAKPDVEGAVQSNQHIVRNKVGHLVRCALGSAHSVTKMKDGLLIGNQVEVSMVSSVGWQLGEKTVEMPDGSSRLYIGKKLEFDHHRMTSGVVVREEGSNDWHVFIKGSYENIRDICKRETVPDDYDAFTQGQAKNGYYILGLSHKILQNVHEEDLGGMSRDALEVDLSMIGLLNFRNEMKHDSPEAMAMLQEGDIKNLICTGDNSMTGISIGRQCGIISKGAGVLLGEVSAGSGCIEWRDVDNDNGLKLDPFDDQYENYMLAVTQAGWRFLCEHTSYLDQIWTRIAVYGRMKPDDKMNLIAYLQGHDKVVGMCGDGGNDCGALRAAHAGLALSDAEASFVSPFSTCRDDKSLITMVDVIREGRACLATNLASFTYWMSYGLLLPSLRLWLNLKGGANFGEYFWLFNDIVIGGMFTWTATVSRPEKRLSNFRPTASLLGFRTWCTILFSAFMGVLTMLVASFIMWSNQHAGWYRNFNAIKDIGLPGHKWMLRGDNHDASVVVLTLLITLTNTCYFGSLGGTFRAQVIRNWFVNIGYALLLAFIFVLLLAPTSRLHCVFRVNCDNKYSLKAKSLGPVAWLSVGGVGGCFMGPQLVEMQEQVQNNGGNKGWLPEPEDKCLPPPNLGVNLDVSVNGCEGPNNCFSTKFKWQFAGVLMFNILSFWIFYWIVLLGPVAAQFRKAFKKEVEMQLITADAADGSSVYESA